jgi:hypothetical protein
VGTILAAFGEKFLSKTFFGALALSTLAIIGICGCKRSTSSAPSIGGNLGSVDGDPISYDQFYSYLQRKPVIFAAVQGRQIQVQVADTLGIQTMRDLVQQRLLLEIAKEEGVSPSEAAITKELDIRRKQNPSYISDLENAGLSLDDIKYDIQLGLASEGIQTKGVVVTAQEAKSYIAANKKSFSTPPQANLLLIVAKNASDKAHADADLKSGQNFGAVAMHWSSAPQARENGGVFGTTNVAEMPPVLQKIVASTPEDKTSAWIKNGTNWVKFFVKSKSPAKAMPVDADLISAVERDLAKKKSPNGPDFQKKLLAKLKTAKVDLNSKFYQEGWQKYVASSESATSNPSAGR